MEGIHGGHVYIDWRDQAIQLRNLAEISGIFGLKIH